MLAPPPTTPPPCTWECLVGFIAFGAMVTVYELQAGAMPKSYVLRGSEVRRGGWVEVGDYYMC